VALIAVRRALTLIRPPAYQLHVSFLTGARSIVGDPYVSTDKELLNASATATFRTSATPAAIVRPASTHEVQRLVLLARRCGQPLYPVSGGRNWGFGSRVPTVDGAVIVDLERMNRLVELDVELAYVSVEPGVTFLQLHDELAAHAPGLFLPAGGGPSDASLIGNLVERGDGVGPYGDRASHACGLEVVLPTGELVRTGPSRHAGDACRHLSRRAAGPGLDELFLQSRWGIVTRATFWLRPKPVALRAFVASVRDTDGLAPVLDALRELALCGALEDECVSLWNGYKVRSVVDQPPQLAPCAWSLTGAVYAPSRAFAHAASDCIDAKLSGIVDGLRFFEDEHIPADAHDAFLGRPSGRASRSVYAKTLGRPTRRTPEADGCGVLWVCPLLPLAGNVSVKALSSIESACLERGFEPNIGLKPASARTLRAFVLLLYDRRDQAADRRALELHDELHAVLNALGHAPHRLGLASMTAIPPFSDDHASLLRRLTAALDPDDILAPGRYDFATRA
jgi:4-cresol dehydrogenase (hydroxylating)